jgi:GxxExxY protein
MLKIPTALPEEIERLVHDSIGCCIAVHRALGPGLLEPVYSRALSVEFAATGVSFEREKRVPVMYRGELLCEHRLDFVVAEQIVLEIKSVERFADVHHAQLLHYLRLSRLRVGLLVNFNVATLKNHIIRKVL